MKDISGLGGGEAGPGALLWRRLDGQLEILSSRLHLSLG